MTHSLQPPPLCTPTHPLVALPNLPTFVTAATKVRQNALDPPNYAGRASPAFFVPRPAGQTNVTGNPTNYGLYTPQMITDMNLGGVISQKAGSNAVVSLQLQSTPDLSMSFTNHGPPVAIEVDLPGNKSFLRLRALGPQ